MVTTVPNRNSVRVRGVVVALEGVKLHAVKKITPTKEISIKINNLLLRLLYIMTSDLDEYLYKIG